MNSSILFVYHFWALGQSLTGKRSKSFGEQQVIKVSREWDVMRS